MTRLPLFLFAGLSLLLISAKMSTRTYHGALFDPRSGGVAAVILQDRTGGPLASGTCAGCHSGGSFSTQVNIQVLDGSTPVTQYTPGSSYTIRLSVTAGSGSPSGYGGQVTALNSSNQMAGNLTSALTANSQISTIGSVKYLEQNGASATGVFEATWVAPTAGTGNVTLYGIGLATNGNNNTTGDLTSSPLSISLTEQGAPTSISYNSSTYCQSDTDPTPTQTGTGGGTYSAGAGLSINASNGQIDVSASTPGSYTVTYSYSGGSTTDVVTISPSYTTNTSATICSFETYDFNGQTLTSANAGLNTATLQSVDGCDSTVNLTLNVTNVDNGISLNTNTLTANQAGITYQWLDCDNNNAQINGENGQSFTATATGNYAVEVTNGSCVDTSACMTVTVIGLDELGTEIALYPNPTHGEITLSVKAEMIGKPYTVVDQSGRTVLEGVIKSEKQTLQLNALNDGIYFVQIDGASGKIKLIKE